MGVPAAPRSGWSRAALDYSRFRPTILVRLVDEPFAIIDAACSPAFHVRVVSLPTDDNYSAYLEAISAEFRRVDKFALILNTGDQAAFPSKFRDIQARWLAETRAEFEGRWICSAFVIPSRVVRGVLMALFWMDNPYYAHTVVADDEKAWLWTRAQMAAAGIDLPGAGE
jgi:hypothetical protein